MLFKCLRGDPLLCPGFTSYVLVFFGLFGWIVMPKRRPTSTNHGRPRTQGWIYDFLEGRGYSGRIFKFFAQHLSTFLFSGQPNCVSERPQNSKTTLFGLNFLHRSQNFGKKKQVQKQFL